MGKNPQGWTVRHGCGDMFPNDYTYCKDNTEVVEISNEELYVKGLVSIESPWGHVYFLNRLSIYLKGSVYDIYDMKTGRVCQNPRTNHSTTALGMLKEVLELPDVQALDLKFDFCVIWQESRCELSQCRTRCIETGYTI